MKVLIGGGPGTGKTTLAGKMAADAAHTDDLIPHGWDGAIERTAKMLDSPEPAVIEGVAVARGLRKWLADHPTGKPCDEVIWLQTPKEKRTRGQEIMAKGLETVFSQIEPELRRRGVAVRRK